VQGKGTGLGLAVVYSTVQNHGGQVTIDSSPGQGTTVTIYLPRSSQKVEGEAQDTSRGQASRAGTVLVVDDEQMVRRSVGRLLRTLGFDVILAEGGKRALELYRASADKIACVLLDIMMPEMDGIETYAQLKTIDPDLRVIFSSGRPDERRLDSLLEAEATGFIAKPYESAKLIRALDQLLDPP